MKKSAIPAVAVPLKAMPIRLAHSDAMSTAFDAIIDQCLTQVLRNARSITASHQPRKAGTARFDLEYLHQMRIGLRRLKVAIGLFSAPVPCPPSLREEIAWLATELGRLRDWDVLLGTTLPHLRQWFPDEAGLPALCEHAAKLAAKGHQALPGILLGPRYTAFLHLLEAWRGDWRAAIAELEAASRVKGKWKLSSFAEHALRVAYKKLQRRSKHQADTRQRHRLRIAAKKMRYTMEFFESLYTGGKVRSYAKVLAQLQETLGELNDAAVADGLLRQWAHDATAEAASFARGAMAGATPARLAQLRTHIRQFARADTPF